MDVTLDNINENKLSSIVSNATKNRTLIHSGSASAHTNNYQ
jgi:hypothetical protein